MKHPASPDDMADHEELSALLPWYVNDTLSDRDRHRFEAHLGGCAACRTELHQERQIHERMSAKPGVEYLAAPSLQRLQARLDLLRANTPAAPSLDAVPAACEPAQPELPPKEALPAAKPDESVPSLRRAMGLRRPLMRTKVAAALVLAAAFGVLAANRWHVRIQAFEPNYRTVTSTASRPSAEVIRAVFAPTVTLVDLQAILDDSQLRIVAGPTEAGVYSLAATSSRSVGASLAILRRHPNVRFAESTLPGDEPGQPR